MSSINSLKEMEEIVKGLVIRKSKEGLLIMLMLLILLIYLGSLNRRKLLGLEDSFLDKLKENHLCILQSIKIRILVDQGDLFILLYFGTEFTSEKRFKKYVIRLTDKELIYQRYQKSITKS
jgi:hypothetical protein